MRKVDGVCRQAEAHWLCDVTPFIRLVRLDAAPKKHV